MEYLMYTIIQAAKRLLFAVTYQIGRTLMQDIILKLYFPVYLLSIPIVGLVHLMDTLICYIQTAGMNGR